jgi:hypothetical protein
MVMTTGRSTFPVRSAGGGLTQETAFQVDHPVMSSTVLADTVDLMRLLERRLEGRHCEEPETTQAALGRLEAWARARPWEVPPRVVEKVDRVLQAAEQAYSTISAAGWIESLPDEICDLLDRRRPAFVAPRSAAAAEAERVESVAGAVGGRSPRRRASDR